MLDSSNLPVSPVFLLAAAIYAGISTLITGPEIAERQIARSEWHQVCTAEIHAELESTRRPDRVIPNVPSFGDLLCGPYPELSEFCAMIPDPNAIARETERKLRAQEDERIRRAAAGSADQCGCAEQVYLAEERLSLALYAASARLVTPQSVQNRETALTRALRSPSCAYRRQG